MANSRSNLLFYGRDLGALIHGYEGEIRKEVESWERNKILAASEPDLVAYLVGKYTLDPPRLLRDQFQIESEGEAKIDASGVGTMTCGIGMGRTTSLLLCNGSHSLRRRRRSFRISALSFYVQSATRSCLRVGCTDLFPRRKARPSANRSGDRCQRWAH